ncbi:MAG: hypothetical protein PHI49_12550 [Halothiobacillaceae bacterium]|nr:hypothetical protein [Halothiobacillaceae bacterium]
MSDVSAFHSRALVALRTLHDQHGPVIEPGEPGSLQRLVHDDQQALTRLAGAAGSRNELPELDMRRAEQALARWTPDAAAARVFAGAAERLLEDTGLEGEALARARAELARVSSRVRGGEAPKVATAPTPAPVVVPPTPGIEPERGR